MSQDSVLNVSTGKPQVGGAIFSAPEGTAVPTDAIAPLTSAFENVGFCSDAGLTNEITTETGSIKAWGGIEVMKPQTSRTESFKFTMIETNPIALARIFGEDNVVIDSVNPKNFTVKHNAKEREIRPWVIELLLTNDRVKRIVIPRGQITSLDAITYNDSDAIGYGVTLSCYPSDAEGNTAFEYVASIVSAEE
jgi:hypothetical protein